MSGPNFDHMDQGIYDNREGLKKLEKQIVPIDWEVVKEVNKNVQIAAEAAAQAEAAAGTVDEAMAIILQAEQNAEQAATQAETAAHNAAEATRAEVESIATAAAHQVVDELVIIVGDANDLLEEV